MTLKWLSAIHNLILTIWSTIMTIGISVEVIKKIIMVKYKNKLLSSIKIF